MILVTGATGYVGGRLIPKLLQAGYAVRCLVRDRGRMPDQWWSSEVDIVEADVLNFDSLEKVFNGVDQAYYLIHSLGGMRGDLVSTEVQAASNFGRQAKLQGVDRIIYLGGLEPKPGQQSKHLRSRIETGDTLRSSGVSVTEFRAGVVVGSGSLSFELVRYLTERVPFLITPKWVSTKTQPIGIRDVLSYLTEALSTPESRDQIIEIGGADVLSYAEMFAQYAVLRGLKRPIVKVPVLTPRLSSLCVGLVTPINTQIARLLIDGLDNEVVVTNDLAKRLFEIQPASYSDAVARALQRFDSDEVETYWSGSISSGIVENQVFSTLDKSENLITEKNTVVVDCRPIDAYKTVCSLGGDTGWLYADFLWRIRGFIDTAVGGTGMRKSRRSRSLVQPGDTIDFWRVEKADAPNYLLLRAEMKLPGSAWLEFNISEHESGKTTISQTAYYEPKGLSGLLYWYLFSIPHQFIFPGMLKRIGVMAGRRYQEGK
ncbi:SDR family oxidoreductase [bacterium]|nr:SDR family oxidoreductase [bacterium]